MPVYLLENQSSKKPPEKRGAETVLLIDPPLHPNVTHDKRLPRPDTLLHMKAAFDKVSQSTQLSEGLSIDAYWCAFNSLYVQGIRRWSLLQGQILQVQFVYVAVCQDMTINASSVRVSINLLLHITGQL